MSQHAQSKSAILLRCGVALVCAGTIICAVGSLMVKPVYQHIGYIAAASVIGSFLLVFLLSLRSTGRRMLSRPVAIAYIAVSVAMVCYVFVSALQSGFSEIPTVGILVGLLGLLWAAFVMTLALDLRTRTPRAMGLCTLAAANSTFSLVLGTRLELNKVGSVALSGPYVIMIGIQIYLMAVLLHRETLRLRAFERL